jgi:hypothetical protein
MKLTSRDHWRWIALSICLWARMRITRVTWWVQHKEQEHPTLSGGPLLIPDFQWDSCYWLLALLFFSHIFAFLYWLTILYMTSLNFPSFFHCTLRFKYILNYCITMHMLFVQHHTFSCVFECCNNTLKAGQQYTGSKLNKKLENFTRGQN